jgi:hypothetical protein
MKSSIISLAFMTVVLPLTSTVVFAEQPASTAVQDAKTKVYEMLGKDTATLSFENGSTALSEAERQNLAAVVAAVRANATISSAIVAAWSDRDYPANKGQRLGRDQRQLAEERVSSVKKALESLGVAHIETHSMAEQPGVFGKLFNTEDTMIKGEGKVEDANDRYNDDIGHILRDHGGAGKSVVIIRRLGDQSAY